MDVLDDRRLRHHPRRPTFTAATLAAASPLILKPLRTNLAHAAGIPLVASEFGFLSVEGYSSTRARSPLAPRPPSPDSRKAV